MPGLADPMPEPPIQDDGEPIVVPIEHEFDLHAFGPRDVVAAAHDYLEAAHDRGFREVRLVHGRGIGAQRAAVQRMLASHPLVERFEDDPRSHLGATIVTLRRPR